MDQYSQRDELALQIVHLAQAQILLQNPFMAEAVGRLLALPAPMEGALSAPKELRPFTTDGEKLGFDPGVIIQNFRVSEGQAPTHDLLHSVIHCVFLHPFVGRLIDGNLWSLAADIAAERVVIEMLGPRPDPLRAPAEKKALQFIEDDLHGRASAEKIYQRLKAGQWASMIPAWENIFASDEHVTWYAPPTVDDKNGTGESEQGDAADSSKIKGPEQAAHGEKQKDPLHTPQLDKKNQQPGVGDNEAESSNVDNDSELSDAPGDEQAPPNAEERPSDLELDQEKPPSRSSQTGFTDESSGKKENQSQPSAETPDADIHASNDQATNPGQTPSSGSAKVRAQGDGAGEGKESYSSITSGMDIHTLERQFDQHLEEQKKEWTQVASDLSLNMQTFEREQTSAFSGFMADLELTMNHRVDYRSFLRQFAAMGEVMRTSDEEFDYVYYTYGMKLFGKMPLIEPLESREEKRIREFVIVVDTSGSVQGEIVRSFMDTTFDILKSTESFHERVNLRIIQCDARVQSCDTITSLSELKAWGRSLRIFGGGGTDFRPAFRYVDGLIDAGDFEDLGGLIYFTDGWGTYPEWVPSYRTAFVFYDENFRPETVPPWAIQAVLNKDTLEGRLS